MSRQGKEVTGREELKLIQQLEPGDYFHGNLCLGVTVGAGGAVKGITQESSSLKNDPDFEHPALMCLSCWWAEIGQDYS